MLVTAHAHIVAHIQPSPKPHARPLPSPAPELRTILEFTEFVATAANSPRQRERVARAARAPVTGAGLTALRAVERHGPIAVSQLARKVRVDLSTMSRQLRPLETAGLVARASDPDDGRVAWLTITPAGRAVLTRVDEAVIEDFGAALADWSPADRAALARLLDRFRAGLLHNRALERGEPPDPR